MATMFFGFALADSMFSGDVTISRKALSPQEAKDLLDQGFVSGCNPSHAATVAAAKARFGVDAACPEKPERVALNVGDSLVVMGVRGLGRLTDRHEYTEAEIASATFSFSVYTIL